MTPTLRVPLHEHTDYHRRACLGADPNRFHQGDGERWERAEKRIRKAALELCAHCPVLQACRAAGKGAEWGLWGGILHRRDHGRGTATRELDLLGERR
jgi:hypothetical protein